MQQNSTERAHCLHGREVGTDREEIFPSQNNPIDLIGEAVQRDAGTQNKTLSYKHKKKTHTKETCKKTMQYLRHTTLSLGD